MNIFKTAALCLAMGLSAQMATAQGWNVNADLSNLAFGSVKNDAIGETHHFRFASGTVSKDGAVTLALDLSSVDTGIDIRNERFAEFVFANAPSATIAGKVDMAAIEALGIGEQMPLEVEVTLGFLGHEISVDAPVIAVRLSEGRAMVMSDGFIWLDTEELAIDAGIDKLQELASLSSITRAVPVAFRLTFDMKM